MAVWTDVSNQARLAADFEANIKSLVEDVAASMMQMHSTMQGLVALVDDAREKSEQLACATEETNRNVQAVAAAAEELSASISEIRRQVDQPFPSAAERRSGA